MAEAILAIKECTAHYESCQTKINQLHHNVQQYIIDATKTMEEVKKLSEVINSRAAKRAMNPTNHVPLREKFDWAKTQSIKKMQLELTSS